MIFPGLFSEPVTRDQARDLARDELEKPIYHRERPSFLDKMIDQIREWFDKLTPDGVKRPGGGGGDFTLLILVVLFVLLAVAVVWWMRGRGNTKAAGAALLDDVPSSATDHRSAAAAFAAEGRFAEAIRERLRAIARDLEERAILDPRPGRTARELAHETLRAMPVDLSEGVGVFDDVWYGDRPGTPEGYALLVALDEEVRAARPRPLERVP
ncbi:DUF4129 domain-containing protein [Actinocorallia longicatena]|uniref:DUF4129 domain-containing protein n=1 Tax=Actinocorallia longicatena TaxID=111803 RepID=A0ABP6QLE5_9ACTN